MDFSEEVKTALWDLIDEMSQNKLNYVVHPSKDFSRKKKWDFPTLMKFIISMESQSLKNELHKYFAFSSLICMAMAIYSGHKMISGKSRKKKETAAEESAE